MNDRSVVFPGDLPISIYTLSTFAHRLKAGISVSALTELGFHSMKMNRDLSLVGLHLVCVEKSSITGSNILN